MAGNSSASVDYGAVESLDQEGKKVGKFATVAAELAKTIEWQNLKSALQTLVVKSIDYWKFNYASTFYFFSSSSL